MLLDLRKIIDQPGSSKSFETRLDVSNLNFFQVERYVENPVAVGTVYNEAGVLHLKGSVTADMICICDRCGKEFESEKVTEVDVVLAEEDLGDDPNLYLIEDGSIDVGEVMATCFILDMETKFLCSEDCNGADKYAPRKEPDPRFAKLTELLNQEDK